MRTPRSTYRLQIHEGFTLTDATAQLRYLTQLGVDWIYLSPILTAEKGSTHGYDVTDPTIVDESRGGAAALEALATAAHDAGMGVLVDIVPNHQGVATPADNPWWWSVLAEGPASPYARAFDIDWDANDGRLLLPVLGSAADVEQLQLVDGQLAYYDHRFPVAAGTADDGADAATVHTRQHYELADWRRGDAELNYRRFFSIATLAGVRVEDAEVFDASHTEIRRWVTDGLVDGLRIDHPDGLRDPAGYLDALADATGGVYVLVEKILEPGERLPSGWATAGTTGYDALADVDRLFTDPAGEAGLDAVTGGVDWAQLIHGTKRDFADGTLLAETRRLVRELPGDIGLDEATAQDALAELLACFPVYRSYLPEDGAAHLHEAAHLAVDHRPDLAAAVDVLVGVLQDETRPVAQRFQQTSGMVMAKGVEDTAFYRYTRLTSLTEVGADPSVFSIGIDAFHQKMAERASAWPDAMSALTTHDTKRSEDTRARISVLSELPDRWARTFARLQELAPIPDAPIANLVWQAAVGAWPISRERLKDYVLKAAREAGTSTTWTDQNEAFEAALTAAVDAAHDRREVTRVIEDLVGLIEGPGYRNSLAAKLIQLTMPGVPDVYQGTEFWDFSLVDPDNRRPVDYASRATALAELEFDPQPEIGPVGVAKLHVVRAALHARRDRPELFTAYRPVTVSGPAAAHVIAFDRGGEAPGAVTVATRLPVGLAARGGLGETTISLAAPTADALTGRAVPAGRVRAADILGDLGVALLLPTGGDPA
ncbi:malto-oligosyltrehalose synthase [Tersicoccus solisilvae]|uniref:Malto-oligosyltrehalose synthase n=1 Tax=Tersicoccus solisilvae TaxID=1882339 RepID=A0ABQ1NW09_9MICC|nr:malto-oligosyltrehalose synthase [Tersicoccus solisilvae]GGC85848.1 malto-oligosyltrehalose synthase [Tersicoccus solisilvae]